MNFISSSASLKWGKLNTTGKYTIDLSRLYGNYYIGLGLWNGTIEMKEMWLEQN